MCIASTIVSAIASVGCPQVSVLYATRIPRGLTQVESVTMVIGRKTSKYSYISFMVAERRMTTSMGEYVNKKITKLESELRGNLVALQESIESSCKELFDAVNNSQTSQIDAAIAKLLNDIINPMAIQLKDNITENSTRRLKT